MNESDLIEDDGLNSMNSSMCDDYLETELTGDIGPISGSPSKGYMEISSIEGKKNKREKKK